MVLEALPGAKVLGKLVLPITDPADPIHFASIHNNPPGKDAGRASLVLNRFGEGKVIYAAGDLESSDTAREVFVNLVRVLGGRFSFEADAPKPVEITLFHQAAANRYIISLLNFQVDLPNIPVEGIQVRVNAEGITPKRLLVLPEEKALEFVIRDGYVAFSAPRLETFAMFALEYE